MKQKIAAALHDAITTYLTDRDRPLRKSYTLELRDEKLHCIAAELSMEAKEVSISARVFTRHYASGQRAVAEAYARVFFIRLTASQKDGDATLQAVVIDDVAECEGCTRAAWKKKAQAVIDNPQAQPIELQLAAIVQRLIDECEPLQDIADQLFDIADRLDARSRFQPRATVHESVTEVPS